MLFSTTDPVWWYLPYDDPETGKHFDFEWQVSAKSRIANDSGCPFLNNQAVWRGYNDLETCYPEIAAQWHPIKNRKRKPWKYMKWSNYKAWWLCPECGHEWRASIVSRTKWETKCPVCQKAHQYDDLFMSY